MKHLISFSNTESDFSTDRFLFEARLMNIFDDIKIYSENDFDEEYSKKYSEFFKEKRGYGYWCWKSYIIKQSLNKMTDGDILMYVDCGCSFIPSNRRSFYEWTEKLDDNACVMNVVGETYYEFQYTRCDLFEFINSHYNIFKKDLMSEFPYQRECSILLFRKCDKTEKFVNDWYDICHNYHNLITDEVSSIKNFTGFIENRHDQSAFSLLSKCAEMISTNDASDKKTSCCIPTRIKNDKNSWIKPLTIFLDDTEMNDVGNAIDALSKNEIIDNYVGYGNATGKQNRIAVFKKSWNPNGFHFNESFCESIDLCFSKEYVFDESVKHIISYCGQSDDVLKKCSVLIVENENDKQDIIKRISDIDINKIFVVKSFDAENTKRIIDYASGIRIHISTHIDYDFLVKSKIYDIITDEDVEIHKSPLIVIKENNTELSARSFSYAEGSRMYYLYKNPTIISDYIGFCQYRKYFECLDDVPTIHEIEQGVYSIERFDVCVREQYKNSHNEDDLIKIENIAKKLYPDFYDSFEEYLNQNDFIRCNMFIIPKEKYMEMCKIVFDILLLYDNEMNFNSYSDIFNYVNTHSGYDAVNKKYQSRIEGFLLERMVGAFLYKNFKNPILYDILITGEQQTY